jgi:hypothetical protein
MPPSLEALEACRDKLIATVGSLVTESGNPTGLMQHCGPIVGSPSSRQRSARPHEITFWRGTSAIS